MKISDRLSKAFHQFLDKHGDFRHTDFDEDEIPIVFWDNWDLDFNPLFHKDTKCTTKDFHRRVDGTIDLVFTFQLRIFNKWAVIADDLFDNIERGFTCSVKAHAKSDYTPMDIEKLTIDIQAGLHIDENRLLGAAILIETATEQQWHSDKIKELIGLIGSKEIDTGEDFEQRLMWAILADDYSHLLKT